MKWPIQDAKNKLSQVIACAQREGPQIISRHGREVAVLLAYGDYQKLMDPKVPLAEFIRQSPLGDIQADRDDDREDRGIDL